MQGVLHRTGVCAAFEFVAERLGRGALSEVLGIYRQAALLGKQAVPQLDPNGVHTTKPRVSDAAMPWCATLGTNRQNTSTLKALHKAQSS